MLSMEKPCRCCVLLLILFIVCQVRPGHTQKDASCFSFIHTNKKSPLTLEDTCFEISNNRANLMYTGIYLHMGNSPCTYHNIQLEEIKKYIIHDDHQRPLCRRKTTISLKRTQCTETIAKLQHLCEEPKSIYFQDCFPVTCPRSKENNINEAGAIIISGFPKPMMGNIGQGVYGIPASQCIMKKCKLDNWSIEELKEELKERIQKNGATQQEVATAFGVHQSTVRQLKRRLQQFGNTDNRPRTGRPRVTTPRQDPHIHLEHLRNRFKTVVETAATIAGR